MSVRRSVIASGIALLTILLGTSCSQPESTTPPDALTARPASSAPMPQPASFQVADGLPPVQGNLAFAARPAETVRAAYLFAAKHPEVLKYVPCFCGCERMGHSGNDDCFVGKRDAKGNPTQWETHGMICEICIDVATDAMQMHSRGVTVTAIRAAIDQKYGAGRPHTPTPLPPHGSGTSHQ